MVLEKQLVDDIGALLKNASRILILPHKTPDGDAIGAALGLYQALAEMGKSPQVLCADEPAPVFNFMPNIERVVVGRPSPDFDAYFVVDCGATHLTSFHESHPWLFDKSHPVINIDHHPTNEFYGRYNIVAPEYASTTSLVYELLNALKIPISRDTATCLLTGLYTDTGSFMHSNTNAKMMRIGASLLSRGANLRAISKEIFNTTKISTMHLWGRVLKSIHQTEDGVTMAVVTQQDFTDCGATHDEMTGVVDYVNSIPGAAYSVILTEKQGVVKGSMRTLRDEINVSDIAANYGGGGHAKAAGFSVPGRLRQEVRWKVVEEKPA